VPVLDTGHFNTASNGFGWTLPSLGEYKTIISATVAASVANSIWFSLFVTNGFSNFGVPFVTDTWAVEGGIGFFPALALGTTPTDIFGVGYNHLAANGMIQIQVTNITNSPVSITFEPGSMAYLQQVLYVNQFIPV
jgi:hypothetical protein